GRGERHHQRQADGSDGLPRSECAHGCSLAHDVDVKPETRGADARCIFRDPGGRHPELTTARLVARAAANTATPATMPSQPRTRSALVRVMSVSCPRTSANHREDRIGDTLWNQPPVALACGDSARGMPS